VASRRKTAIRLRDQPRHITIEQYVLAWRLIQGGATEQEIREACHFSPKQVHWVLNIGDDKKQMEPLRQRLRKAQAEIRADMLNRARTVADVGLKAIERSLQNSSNASALVAALMVKLRDKLEKDEEPPPWIGRHLEQLRHYADTSKAAVSFRTLFGDNPAQAGMPSENSPGLHGRRPAALEAAEDEDLTGMALAQHMAGWTKAELDHYIETGDEPVIDVEARER
jgi:hypothetical protein